MKKLVLISTIGALFIITACTHNNVYINRKVDNDEGKMFLDKFYSRVADKDYSTISAMVSDSLKHLVGTDGLDKLLKFIYKKVGSYKSYNIDDFYIRTTIGSNNETTYHYKLKVAYEGGIVEEIIGFKKQAGSKIKINSYHANSDLLIH